LKVKENTSFNLIILISFFLDIWLFQSLFAEEPKRIVIPAEEILKMIKRGEPVFIAHAIISGKLDLAEIELDAVQYGPWWGRVVKSEINISDSEFEEEVDLSWAVFEKPVAFWKGPESPHRKPSITTCRFNKEVSFFMSKFNEGVNFYKAEFAKQVNFTTTEFNNGAGFCQTRFDKDVDFERARFSSSYFAGTWFAGDTDLSSAVFDGNAVFDGARFDGEANFRSAEFNKEAVFSHVGFNKGADLRDATFGAKISFVSTTLETMKIDWKQIKGVVWDNDTRTSTRKLAYDEQFYIFLIKTFKEHGQFRDADEAYYDYRSRTRKFKKCYDPTRVIEVIFLDLSCGYGVKPFRALLFGMAIILIFSGLYYQFEAIKNRGKLDSIPKFKDALYFSVNTFTRVGHGDWYPTEEFLWVWKIKICRFRTLAMLEGLLGWLILALFLITLGKVWIR